MADEAKHETPADRPADDEAKSDRELLQDEVRRLQKAEAEDNGKFGGSTDAQESQLRRGSGRSPSFR